MNARIHLMNFEKVRDRLSNEYLSEKNNFTGIQKK